MVSKSFEEEMSSVSEECSTSSTDSSPRTDNSEGPVLSEQIRIIDASDADDEITENQLFIQTSDIVQAITKDYLLFFQNQDLINAAAGYKVYPPEMGSYLQRQHQGIHNMVNNIMNGTHGWVYVSITGRDISQTELIDVICFTTTEPVKIFTFTDGTQESAAQRHNTRVAGIVTNVIAKHCLGFKFAVVYGALRSDISDEGFAQKMQDCDKSAYELSLPHSLEMNFEKFKSVSMGFLKEISERDGSSELMDTHDLKEKVEAQVEGVSSVCMNTKGSELRQDGADENLHAGCVSLSEHQQLKMTLCKLQNDYMKLKSLFDQERGVAFGLGGQCSHDYTYERSESGSDVMSEISSTSSDSGLQDDINTISDNPVHAGRKRSINASFSGSPAQKRPRTEHRNPRMAQQLPIRLTRRSKRRLQKHLPEKYSSTTNTSLHIAAAEGLLGTVENIHSCGFIDINCRGEGGKTSLMLAAENGKVNVFDYLVSSDCDRSVTDDDGNTILHAACIGGDFAIIKRVLQWGMVDKNLKNSSGLTPMMVAEGSGKIEVCKLLTSWNCH